MSAATHRKMTINTEVDITTVKLSVAIAKKLVDTMTTIWKDQDITMIKKMTITMQLITDVIRDTLLTRSDS